MLLRPQAAWTAILAALLASAPAMAIEEPAFRTLEQDGSFELREYSAYVVAETRVAAAFDRAGNVAFKRLFRYISGNNTSQQEIAMTAPVTQSLSEKIAMTAPVSQQADGTAYRVAFTLPSNYTLATAPKPLDPTIEIRSVPARLVAVWRYSGRWTQENYRENEQKLRAQIDVRGLTAKDEPILARYNSPFTPWFLRRNEVMIPVRRPELR